MPVVSDVQTAIDEIAKGNFVIIVDDEDRENEGDLAFAAEKVTPEKIAFMANHARGLICAPIKAEQLENLQLPLMVENNTAPLSTAFTVTVDATSKFGVSTGISAADRSATIKALIDPDSKSDDLARPGHIFPLRYREGGVLMRAGQTEAIIDLAVLAGLHPSGVICEIMKEDGTMARMPDLQVFSDEFDIPIVTVAQIIAYRHARESLVERVATAQLPTKHGMFVTHGYKSSIDFNEHIVLVMGDIDPETPTLVRAHSECATGDVLGSSRCDCGDQVELALQRIAAEGSGIFMYLRQEGRGVGLHNKLRAYALQDQGLDTVEANEELGFLPDLRDYGVGVQILLDLGVKRMKIMTNNPRKLAGLEGFGIEVDEIVPIQAKVTPFNRRYLETKKGKMGHLLTNLESPDQDDRDQTAPKEGTDGRN
tara:strand:- start:11920 stop:13194 length:1275 start_codon:yes stop_codon:yes gene_type:complete